MPSFGKVSRERLSTCDERLQAIAFEVINHFDFSVICGYRDEKKQHDAFSVGNSQVDWPESRHNSMPSMAIDIAPYPIDWDDVERFTYLAGMFMFAALRRPNVGVLRWGGDWDRDTQVLDEEFSDRGHFEIVGV